MRDYRREQSSALCHRFLSQILTVPSLTYSKHGSRPSRLAWGLDPSAAPSSQADTDALYQAQPLSAAPFDRKELLSAPCREILRSMRDTLTPKLVPYSAHSFKAAVVLPEILNAGAPAERDVPLMIAPSSLVRGYSQLLSGRCRSHGSIERCSMLPQDCGLLAVQTLASAAQIPVTTTMKTPAARQVCRAGDLHVLSTRS